MSIPIFKGKALGTRLDFIFLFHFFHAPAVYCNQRRFTINQSEESEINEWQVQKFAFASVPCRDLSRL